MAMRAPVMPNSELNAKIDNNDTNGLTPTAFFMILGTSN
jgi:hypothetical protein